MRIRLTFAKTEAMRFTGHLDLHRSLERVLRRAGLPIAYSEGFNPRPRLNLASALPLGFTSAGELADFLMTEEQPLPDIEAALREALPPGIEILNLESVPPRLPKLQTQMQSAEFHAALLLPQTGLDERIANLLAADTLPRERRRKRKVKVYDLRPLILDVQRREDDELGRPRLYMHLRAQEGATGRPDEVLDALEISAHDARITRTRLILAPQEPTLPETAEPVSPK